MLVAAAWVFLFTGTPLFGPTLTLQEKPIASIEFSMFSIDRTITASNQCAQVLQVLRTSRQAGPVYTVPALATLTLHYEDGMTNRFYLQPAKRIGAVDLIDETGAHTISTRKMFQALQTVGLMPKEQR